MKFKKARKKAIIFIIVSIMLIGFVPGDLGFGSRVYANPSAMGFMASFDDILGRGLNSVVPLRYGGAGGASAITADRQTMVQWDVSSISADYTLRFPISNGVIAEFQFQRLGPTTATVDYRVWSYGRDNPSLPLSWDWEREQNYRNFRIHAAGNLDYVDLQTFLNSVQNGTALVPNDNEVLTTGVSNPPDPLNDIMNPRFEITQGNGFSFSLDQNLANIDSNTPHAIHFVWEDDTVYLVTGGINDGIMYQFWLWDNLITSPPDMNVSAPDAGVTATINVMSNLDMSRFESRATALHATDPANPSTIFRTYGDPAAFPPFTGAGIPSQSHELYHPSNILGFVPGLEYEDPATDYNDIEMFLPLPMIWDTTTNNFNDFRESATPSDISGFSFHITVAERVPNQQDGVMQLRVNVDTGGNFQLNQSPGDPPIPVGADVLPQPYLLTMGNTDIDMIRIDLKNLGSNRLFEASTLRLLGDDEAFFTRPPTVTTPLYWIYTLLDYNIEYDGSFFLNFMPYENVTGTYYIFSGVILPPPDGVIGATSSIRITQDMLGNQVSLPISLPLGGDSDANAQPQQLYVQIRFRPEIDGIPTDPPIQSQITRVFADPHWVNIGRPQNFEVPNNRVRMTPTEVGSLTEARLEFETRWDIAERDLLGFIFQTNSINIGLNLSSIAHQNDRLIFNINNAPIIGGGPSLRDVHVEIRAGASGSITVFNDNILVPINGIFPIEDSDLNLAGIPNGETTFTVIMNQDLNTDETVTYEFKAIVANGEITSVVPNSARLVGLEYFGIPTVEEEILDTITLYYTLNSRNHPRESDINPNPNEVVAQLEVVIWPTTRGANGAPIGFDGEIRLLPGSTPGINITNSRIISGANDIGVWIDWDYGSIFPLESMEDILSGNIFAFPNIYWLNTDLMRMEHGFLNGDVDVHWDAETSGGPRQSNEDDLVLSAMTEMEFPPPQNLRIENIEGNTFDLVFGVPSEKILEYIARSPFAPNPEVFYNIFFSENENDLRAFVDRLNDPDLTEAQRNALLATAYPVNFRDISPDFPINGFPQRITDIDFTPAILTEIRNGRIIFIRDIPLEIPAGIPPGQTSRDYDQRFHVTGVDENQSYYAVVDSMAKVIYSELASLQPPDRGIQPNGVIFDGTHLSFEFFGRGGTQGLPNGDYRVIITNDGTELFNHIRPINDDKISIPLGDIDYTIINPTERFKAEIISMVNPGMIIEFSALVDIVANPPIISDLRQERPLYPDNPILNETPHEIFSKTTNIAALTTVGVLPTPDPSDIVPAAPVVVHDREEEDAISLTTARISWNRIAPPLPASAIEGGVGHIEYQIVRVRNGEIDGELLDNRALSLDEFVGRLPSGATPRAFQTTTGAEPADRFLSERTASAWTVRPNGFNYDITAERALLHDTTLSPNTIYFYYVRTVWIVYNTNAAGEIPANASPRSMSFSSWRGTSVTTTPVRAPMNLQVLRGTDIPNGITYNPLNQMVISFEAPVSDIARLGTDFSFQYSLMQDSNPWGAAVSMDSGILRQWATPSRTTGYYRFVYVISGLRTGTQYSVRVRMQDLRPPGDFSAYSNIVTHRTNTSQEDYDRDRDVQDLNRYLRDLLMEALRNHYWIAQNNLNTLVAVYRPSMANDWLSQTTNTLANLVETGHDRAVYYIPQSVLLDMRDLNRGMLVTNRDMEVMIPPNAISVDTTPAIIESSRRIRDLPNTMDYYLRITAQIRPFASNANIDARPPVGQEVAFTVELVETNRTIRSWDAEVLEQMMNRIENDFYTQWAIAEIRQMIERQLSYEAMVRRLHQISEQVMHQMSIDINNSLNSKIIGRAVAINQFSSPISVLLNNAPQNSIVTGYQWITNNWMPREAIQMGTSRAIQTDLGGTFAFTARVASFPGIATLPNAQTLTDVMLQYGLDDFLGNSETFSLTSNATVFMTAGVAARLAGAPSESDPIAWLRDEGYVVPTRAQNANVNMQEMVYMMMSMYEIRTNTRVDAMRITNFNRTSGIQNIDPRFLRSIQGAMELDFILSNSFTPTANPTVGDLLRMVEAMNRRMRF
ncbi:MAG: hypothetical protein FWD01_01310 [Defluviitaleaceae bacterium]|nr:hypothetical protein [Defluviitaleaceae bacterium]